MKPWFMLSYLLVCQIGVAFLGRSIGPLSPFLERSFHLDSFALGLLPAFFFAGQALISIPAGVYSDHFGTRKINLIVSIEISMVFFLVSLIHNFFVLLVLLFLAGMGYGSMHPSSSRGVRDWFHQGKSGTAMGIKQMGVTLGSSLAALILLPLAITYSWRTSMEFSALVVLIIGAVIYFLYRDQPHYNNHDKFSIKDVIKLVHNKNLFFVSLVSIGLNGVQLCYTTFIVLFFHDKLQLSLVMAGTFLIISEISGTVGRLLWGMVSDKLFGGNRISVLMMITVIGALGLIVQAMAPRVMPLQMLLTAVIGLCIAGFNGIWMNIASESVSGNKAGMASGFSLSIGSLGVLIIPPIFGQIVMLSGSYYWGWIFMSSVLMAAFLLLAGLQLLHRPKIILSKG
jgi:MFS transporter, ACS family, hexuronate transporter